MRLIDADAIKYERTLEPRDDGMYNHANHVYEGDIDAMPTVDAVPVSFIESEIKRMDDEIKRALEDGEIERAERTIARKASLEFTLAKWRAEGEEK